MKVSAAGLDFISEREGCELSAYPDPATGGDPWTIGIGHIKGVKPGDTCSKEQAMKWLSEDIAVVERCINASVKGPITQNQFDALASLVFNIGTGNFGKSTLLKKLNDGDDAGAAKEFLRWNKAAGRVMNGLTKRRAAEMELFSSVV